MIKVFNAGFYNKLISGATLQTKLGGSASDKKIYNTIAPQTASLPYITFGLLTDVPDGVFGKLDAIEPMTFWVNVFSSTSPANCQEIADLVAALMDDCTLTITGYTHMVCMREYVGTMIYDKDVGVYQIPMRYRVSASKN
jgi:hypothetical protein